MYERARSERGSVLLMSLVLIFIMGILGLALFDLGVVESSLVHTAQTDARAFQIAQSGVERALYWLGDWKNTAPTLAEASWASGTTQFCTGGVTAQRGCSESQFHPAASSFISNLTFDGGAYAIEFMQVPYASVSTPCTKDASVNLCEDLMYVRVTGTLSNVPDGYSVSRTIQVLARASIGASTFLAQGLTGEGTSGQPINGNVRIAGSVKIAGRNGMTSLGLGRGSGQRNSWAEIDAVSLARLKPLPKVCPFGRTCTSASDLVESLGATLKIVCPGPSASCGSPPATPVAVSLSSGADLGASGDQTYAADPSRRGKGPLDLIQVGGGCVMPCTGSFSGAAVGSSVFVDDGNITKAYPGPVLAFPLLSDPASVAGVQYEHLACPLGASCTPPASPTTTQEFFVSRAANVMVAGNCTPSCTPIINSLGAAGGLTNTTPPFSVIVTFTNQNNVAMKAMICWDRTAAGLPTQTLEFGLAIPVSNPSPPNCAVPAPGSDPLLLYFPSATPSTTGFTIDRNGGPTDYSYRGSAVVVTNGKVAIEERLHTCLTAGAGSPCQGHVYSTQSSLAVLTTGDMDLGATRASVDRIMGVFYSGGTVTSKRQSNLVGSVAARRLCFAAGSSPCSSGGNIPSFFQVPLDPSNLLAKISSGVAVPIYTAGPVAPYWIECKRGPGTALPTGLCTYAP